MSIFQKKYLKDWLWALTAFVLVFGAVFFPGLSDFANKSFWWKLWDILGIAAALGAVGGWVYFWTKQNSRGGSQ
jgi:hypothetical protein